MRRDFVERVLGLWGDCGFFSLHSGTDGGVSVRSFSRDGYISALCAKYIKGGYI